jgi:very-short-patch-repair endonuclease
MRAPSKTISNARRRRRALSPPEARLWIRLRQRAPGLPVFRRQHPIGPYVLDFYCAKARLAVEIDGMSHDVGARPERDLERDAWLEARGVTVMRIAASEVRKSADETVDAVVRRAASLIEGATPTTTLRVVPLPLSWGRTRAPLAPPQTKRAMRQASEQRPQLAASLCFSR